MNKKVDNDDGDGGDDDGDGPYIYTAIWSL